MKNESNTYAILSIAFGAIGLFIFPITLGPAAIILGVLAIKKDQRRAFAYGGIALGIINVIVGILLLVLIDMQSS